jgi:Uma2 family endonuclease
MTGDTTDRSRLSDEDFEELVRRAPDSLKNLLGLVDGKLSIRHRPLDVHEFEELAATAPEGVRLEFINGNIEVKAMPDGNHTSIYLWLARQCMQHRPDLDLAPERGVKAAAYRNGRAIADAVLVPRHHLAGHGNWSDTEGVLMAVEITSHDRDTDLRDRVDKPRGYAQAGIPVYLLVDRDNTEVTVFTQPENGRYQRKTAYPWGTPAPLPDPVNIVLDTEELKEYAD